MEHKQIACFLQVCDHSSFSKAAEVLYMSQQGLGKTIRNLENELGVPLFERSAKGVRLTRYGTALEKNLRPYLNQHDYIVSQIQAMREGERSNLIIGLMGGMGDFILPHGFFSSFIRAHPEIHCNIIGFYDDSCMQSLRDARIQVGFCPSPINTDLFVSKYARRMREYLVVGSGHRFAGRDSIEMNELSTESIVYPNTKTGMADYLARLMQKNELVPSYNLTFADTKLMIELVSSGCAVGFYAGDPEMLPDTVHLVEIEGLQSYFEYHIIVNRNMYLNEATQVFLDYACQSLAEKEGKNIIRAPDGGKL